MNADEPRRPLLTGRGLVLVEDYQRATGLDTAAIETLAADGRLEAAYRPSGELVGFFDDRLPSAEQLRDWDLSVHHDYDPEALRGYEDLSDDGNDGEPESSSWTMGWVDER